MEFRPYYLAREWVKAGHKVQIICGSYSHIRAVQPVMGGARIKHEHQNGIDYCWFFTPKYNGNGFGRVKSMLSFIWQLWCSARSIARNFKPDVVIASSTYPMDIWPAKKIADISSAKLIYEVHDLWPLSPMELGGMSRWHPFIMWVQSAEDYAYKYADRVISILPETMKYMVSRGMTQVKWAYVPNGVDLKEWEVLDKLPNYIQHAINLIKKRGLPIVCYAGTHGVANALDLLLDASTLLENKVHVLMVGTGPERERLMQRVCNERLENVTMFDAIPKSAIPTLLAQIDIAYIGWHANPMYRFGISPNKLMDYMMASKPVVHSVQAGNDPVAEAGCGVTVSPGDADAVAAAVDELIALNPSDLQKIGDLGKQYVMQNRTYSVLAEQFLAACT
jgi:glycosyltransferase involved in cell wall biosynthesis